MEASGRDAPPSVQGGDQPRLTFTTERLGLHAEDGFVVAPNGGPDLHGRNKSAGLKAGTLTKQFQMCVALGFYQRLPLP